MTSVVTYDLSRPLVTLAVLMEPSQLFCDLSRHPVTLVILMGGVADPKLFIPDPDTTFQSSGSGSMSLFF